MFRLQLICALFLLPALARGQGVAAWADDRKTDNRPSDTTNEFSAAARRAAAGEISAMLRLAAPEQRHVWEEAMALSLRAMAYVIARKPVEAAADCARAEKRLAERPPQISEVETCRNLARAYADLDNYPPHLKALRQVFRHSGRNQQVALNGLAWALATCPRPQFRNGREAVTLAEKASQTTGGKDPAVQDTLAAALAEAGRWDDAVRRQSEAVAIARKKLPAEVRSMEKRLALYQEHKAFREELGPAGHCRSYFAGF